MKEILKAFIKLKKLVESIQKTFDQIPTRKESTGLIWGGPVLYLLIVTHHIVFL